LSEKAGLAPAFLFAWLWTLERLVKVV